jgi:putative heme degradation protein
MERQHVIYYVRRLTASGVQRSESSVSVVSGRSAAETEPHDADWATYCDVYVFAGGLVRNGMGRQKAARMTGDNFNISFSASSARNAGLSDGERPTKKGRMVGIPPGCTERM